MRILFFTGVSPYSTQTVGGAEISIRLLAEQLNKRGHEVTYLTRNRSITPYPLIRQTNLEGINLIVLHTLIGSNYIKQIKTLNNWLLTRYLHKLIHRYGVDIIYCFYDLDFLNNLLNLKSQGLKIKIVMRMAGMQWYEECLKDPSKIKIYENIFNNIDCVNFLHSGLECMVFSKFHELGMNIVLKSSFVGDIGSSASIGRKLDYPDLNNPQFRVVMATRFSSYQKRQDILVKAISLIDKRIPIEVRLIGDGSERERILRMIKDLNLEDRIHIHPFVEQKTLWKELESADLLCHACEYEGVSKIILESMALGLPVLVSNVAPVNEYIEDNENGFLVDNRPQDWADKLVSLYHNKEARVRVSKNGTTFIKEHYDPQKNVIQYEKVFRQILGLHQDLRRSVNSKEQSLDYHEMNKS